jgi:hypothetical protein
MVKNLNEFAMICVLNEFLMEIEKGYVGADRGVTRP